MFLTTASDYNPVNLIKPGNFKAKTAESLLAE